MKKLLLSLVVFAFFNSIAWGQNITTTGVSNQNTCDGSANFTDSSAYQSWTWLDANFGVLQQNGSNINSLCYGYGYLLATDSTGTDTLNYFIDITNNPCANFSAYVNAYNTSGQGICDGTASLQIYGGSAPYSFIWPNGSTDTATVNLCGGNYTMLVTDANNCAFTTTFSVYEDSINTDPCAGLLGYISGLSNSDSLNCNGELYVSVYGGTMPYTYLWSTAETTSGISNLCAGTYTVTVSDANGCTTNSAYTIYDSINSCSSFGLYLVNSNAASSINVCDGNASVATINGVGPYTYTWNNTLGTETNTALCGGINTVTVVDANTGCTASLSIYIYADSSSQNGGLSGYVYPNPPSESGLCDGNAYVELYSGVAPFTFEHSNGDSNQFASNLCAGIYSVLVTDANGDSLILNYIVPEPDEIFNGGNFIDSTVVDTVYTDLITDCLIDYLTLQNAFISSIDYVGTDSLMVVWTVIDSSGTYTYDVNYVLTNGVGVYDLVLQIFCPQRSGNQYVYAIDQVYYNPATASIKVNTTEESELYPVPVENNLFVRKTTDAPAVIQVYDLSGKVVQTVFTQSKVTEIDTHFLNYGLYILKIQHQDSVETLQFIKK